MTTTDTVTDAFDTYCDEVLPAESTFVEIETARLAFFAGAYDVLARLKDSEGLTADEGIAMLDALFAECRSVLEAVAQRAAVD